MSYLLIGSATSPFVRRTRMLMEDLQYELKELDIYDGAEGAAYLHKVSPVHQIPVLIDAEKTIWDSRVIFNYLNQKHKLESMSWEKENLLTAVDGAINSGVTLLLSKRSGLKTEDPVMYFDRQKERMASILDYLKNHMANDSGEEWNIVNMTIYSFLDWALFRKVISIDQRPECRRFLEIHATRPIVKLTQLPKV